MWKCFRVHEIENFLLLLRTPIFYIHIHTDAAMEKQESGESEAERKP